ncbi:serine/threonine protein phosphatase PfPP5, putative [Perkinsus marinus ATCC 50983]|uniref:Serine/threonine protein phosphatase PfPP5, putative n=1 Tax=Perkinsus marinus (strain ATCC 50983 / TXsc) TaxID=423536 RepID=C5KHK8_PERM5|nr:serine/threonine protein phosphatase PfPP5, putative [Perkinsus marinus ATCC 50983]EER16070.1 serine/threonine protein phosphatase PfPP5, putative [Perkinsus marinus ATCC 50983]|eukprot:XP_002784274.1 serine/threonine protein phosphatase PfPP5, putative [Perkinsus marinus ATCC 50983]
MGDSQAADIEKAKGNALYKQRKFDDAIECYNKAIELQPNDLTYYNNKAAVLVEQEKYEECIKLLQDVLAKRYDMNDALKDGASFEKCAKAYVRMATCFTRMNKFDDAIEMYQKALTEDNNRHTRTALSECKHMKEKFEREAYINPELADEHRMKGNECFKAADYAGAKKEYDEAIKRNPSDAKLYSNRAAALTKLMAYPDALRDLDDCLKLDPKFVKAYSRKGTVHFMMKDYKKALEDYEKGLEIDPTHKELLDGKAAVIAKVNEQARSKGAPDPETVRHAMQDPEVQRILADPQMNIVLQQMQENPQKAMEYMKDPKIANALEKLIASGIVRMG